jgi:hypothetical protein
MHTPELPHGRNRCNDIPSFQIYQPPEAAFFHIKDRLGTDRQRILYNSTIIGVVMSVSVTEQVPSLFAQEELC